MAKNRKEVLIGKTMKVKTECGSFYLTLNQQDGNLYEVRMEMGKTGHCQKGMLHLLGVMISNKIQQNEEFKDIRKFFMRHLKEFSCGSPFTTGGVSYKSCIDWAGQQILGELNDEAKQEKSK